MGKSKTTLKLKQNGIDIVWFFADKKKKEKLKLGNVINDEFVYNPIDGKYILEIIGTLGINNWNGRQYNQIIVNDFEIKPKRVIKPSDVFRLTK